LADDIANATSILLGNIANLVGEEDDDEDDGLGSGNGDDSGDDQDDDVEHGREQDEEGNRASLEQHIEDGERSSANDIENTGESARQNYENDRDQGESDNRVEDSSENDGGDDDETMLLQRALALSLASTISAGASDGSNSEHGDDAAKTDASSVKEEDKVIGGVDNDDKFRKNRENNLRHQGMTTAKKTPWTCLHYPSCHHLKFCQSHHCTTSLSWNPPTAKIL